MDIPQSVFDAANEAALQVFEQEFQISRRALLRQGAIGLAGFTALASGCKTTTPDGSEAKDVPNGDRGTFMWEIRQAERLTRVEGAPTLPTGAPNPAFTAAAEARGKAVAKVISDWLKKDPHAMFAQLMSDDFKEPFFSSQISVFGSSVAIGPVIFFRNQSVRECLATTDIYAVEPYEPQMRIATDGNYVASEYAHYILGTDNDDLYRVDDKLLRSVLKREDRKRVSAITRKAAEAIIAEAKMNAAGGIGKLDIVSTLGGVETLGSTVPIKLIDEYMGVHAIGRGQPALNGTVTGGGTFPITADFTKFFPYSKLNGKGVVPTMPVLFDWIKDAFRNIFNNIGSDTDPVIKAFRDRGQLATELISAWIQKLILFYKPLLVANINDPSVPDTMLTRLIKLQLEAEGPNGPTLASDLGTTLADLKKRLTDGRIRANVFGTVTGAATNPNEATVRIVHGMLELRNNKVKAAAGSTYDDAVKAALSDSAADEDARMETLRRFALESLRIYPQAQVLVRTTLKETKVNGIDIRKGSFVFASHAAAMRDSTFITNPDEYDVKRDEKLVDYGQILRDDAPHLAATLGGDRPNQDPQSQVYLHHGYGRHKCLGRYASEMTMAETLRALLRLGDISRNSDSPEYKQDAARIYVTNFAIDFQLRS